ncbi:MAG: signal transduction histidine kinase [Candidatus Pseudothioglobus sp.]|jgi:signal transduction histidine kinase
MPILMSHTDRDRNEDRNAFYLRSILESKIQVNLYAFVSMIVALSAFGSYLWVNLSRVSVIWWLGLVTLALILRVVVMYRKGRVIDSFDYLGLLRFKRALFACSLLMQSAMGAGIWFLGDTATPEIYQSMTAVVCFYGLSVMISLANDFRSYVYSSSLLYCQPLLYWLSEGTGSIWIVATILFSSGIGVMVVRTISHNFAKSTDARFDEGRSMVDLMQSRSETQLALEKAEKAIEDKAFFMASASHDLRQPLFAINMINETLQLHELPDGAQRLLKMQGKSIDAMNYMFNNLLDMSHFESHKVTEVLKDFDIHDLLLTMHDEFSAFADEKKLIFRFDLPKVMVRSDFDLVARVLRNLISNAIKYTTSGEVSASGDVVDGKLFISVCDTGRGIADADHERIFDAFVQLEAMPGVSKTGIGVGLSIVKHIDDLLDLRLQVKSSPGVGTTMRFCLPTSVEQSNVLPR